LINQPFNDFPRVLILVIFEIPGYEEVDSPDVTGAKPTSWNPGWLTRFAIGMPRTLEYCDQGYMCYYPESRAARSKADKNKIRSAQVT
jgi:hypothetical protein